MSLVSETGRSNQYEASDPRALDLDTLDLSWIRFTRALVRAPRPPQSEYLRLLFKNYSSSTVQSVQGAFLATQK